MRLSKFVLIWIALLAWATACTRAEPTPEPTVAPTPTTVVGSAMVDSVELLMMESFPVQINAIVKGNLSDGCTSIDQIGQSRSGNTITVTITATRLADAVCTMALVPFEEIVSLDVLGLSAGSYSVDVNGVRQSFVFSVDNTPEAQPTPTPTPEPAPTGSLGGVVFHDLCPVPVQGAEGAPAGCVTTADGGFQADGVRDAAEPGLEGVVVQLRAGACPGAGPTAETTTAADGSYRFADLAAGAYCVTVDALAEPNATILIPGGWTSPATDDAQAAVTVDVTAGAEAGAPPFGWDYQFLPLPEVEQVANCIDLVSFAADVTIPDDAIFQPGETFVKTWRLINSGGCVWSPQYALRLANGDAMGAAESTPLGRIVPSGQAVEVSVTLTAPDTPGTYRGNWQLANPDGTLLGLDGRPDESFWVQIQVVEGGTFGRVSGYVWNDLCDSKAYVFGANAVVPPGCVENTANGTVRGDGVFDATREQRLAGVVVTIGQGVCGETIDLATTVSDADGNYRFNRLLPATYCVYVDVLGPANAALLPGNFTFPGPGRAGTTLVLEAGGSFENVNFGWDYAEP